MSESPGYRRMVLHETSEFQIVSIQWDEGATSEFHDHGWSRCLVLVEDGRFENTLDLGLSQEVQAVSLGQVVNTPVGARHRMKCVSPGGRTLHVYTPPIHAESQPHFNRHNAERSEGDVSLAKPVNVIELRTLFEKIRESSVSTASPYFMNQLFSGVSPVNLMAEEFMAQTKTTLATTEASPAFSKIESEVVCQLGALIGWPTGRRGGISVPGGSAANFMALHCARQRAFPESKLHGFARLQGSAGFRVYVSSDAHYSMEKACVVLGLGSKSLVRVPVDNQGRMSVEDLSRLVRIDRKNGHAPLMVCATAGTTVRGAFDPIRKLAEFCNSEMIWFHVDGAWGGPALFSQRIRHHVDGIDLADSMTFDAHKLFGAGLTSSFFLTPHEQVLFEANDVAGGDYIFHDTDVDRGRLSWQCGRRAEAFPFWAAWKNAGTEGLGKFVDRLLDLRDEVVEWIEHQPRLQLLGRPDYLNVCVRVLPLKGEPSRLWSKRVRDILIERDIAMVNFANDADGTFLRLILAHPFLELGHVKRILQSAMEIE